MAPVMTPVVSPMGAPMSDTKTPSVRGLRALGLSPSCYGVARSACGRSASTSPRNSFTIHPLAGACHRCGRSRKACQAPALCFEPSGRLRALAEKRPEGSKPRVPRPTDGLFARIRSLMTRPSVGRASRWTKHRIGRVWGRSLRYRSLGLAIASAVTGSVSTGVLPSPCFAWGLRITALRPGGPAQTFVRRRRTKVFALAPSLAATARTFALGNAQTCLPLLRNRAAGARPIKTKRHPIRTNRGSSWLKRFQSTTKAVQSQTKRLDKE